LKKAVDRVEKALKAFERELKAAYVELGYTVTKAKPGRVCDLCGAPAFIAIRKRRKKEVSRRGQRRKTSSQRKPRQPRRDSTSSRPW